MINRNLKISCFGILLEYVNWIFSCKMSHRKLFWCGFYAKTGPRIRFLEKCQKLRTLISIYGELALACSGRSLGQAICQTGLGNVDAQTWLWLHSDNVGLGDAENSSDLEIEFFSLKQSIRLALRNLLEHQKNYPIPCPQIVIGQRYTRVPNCFDIKT